MNGHCWINGHYWIYLIMLLFTIGYRFLKTSEQRRLAYYSACFFLILIFSVQNYTVSGDNSEYMRQYEIITTLTFPQMLVHKFEIGFVLLCRLVAFLFHSERVLMVIMSVLILVPFCWSFERETEEPMLALMVFLALGLFMYSIVYWRQLAAMAILTFSYRYIRQRKFWPFLLIVLVAMTFHKTAIVFVGLYMVYRVPINKRLLLLCGGISVLLGFLGPTIIEIGIQLIYPRYAKFAREYLGGETMLVILWLITLFSYWVFRDRLNEDKIRLPFLMMLIAATIQPVCFAFTQWLRIVLYFRIAMVPMITLLFVELFQRADNAVMRLLHRITPRFYNFLIPLYGKKWFPIAMQLAMFAVLFVWYLNELEGAWYIMAPIYPEGMEIPRERYDNSIRPW